MKVSGPAVAFILVLSVGVLVAQDVATFRSSPFLRIDPDRVVVTDSKGFKPCGECHTPEWDVWKETKHATGFETMHKRDAAQDILTNLNLRVTKREEAVCMRCHYTVGPERKAIAGVSCESCHGAARDWVNVHNKWGGGAKDKAGETVAAREARVAASRAGGMLRPSTDLYAVAANCFECHTVPVEDLVTRGQHKAGTTGFELVKRVNSIRHNFLTAAKSGNHNRPDSPERARVMFVVGRMLAYEYALRGLANATTASSFSRSMDGRVKTASRQLEELTNVTPIPSVTEILRAGSKARLVPNNRAELEAAANEIRTIGQRFVASTSGATLAALDALVAGAATSADVSPGSQPAPGASGGTTSAAAGAAGTSQTGSAGQSTASSTGNAAAGNAAAGMASAATSGAIAPARVELPGQIRSRPAWHSTAAKSGMAEGGECAGCHSEAEAALADSPHQKASRRLYGENAKARRIADLYGIGAANAGKANQICASCHASIDDATKTAQEEGVTCERCHGAGTSYLESHKKGGNPQRGMRALKQANDRVALCAECHRISDERLLAAGHPSGARYDIVAASGKIKHWPGTKPDKGRQKRGESYAGPPDAALRAAFDALASSRPIPRVTLAAGAAASSAAPRATTASSAPGGPAPPQGSALQTSGGLPTPSTRDAQSSMPPFTPRSFPTRAASTAAPLQLEPLPATDRLTTEELMLLVKRRLARLYMAVPPR